MALSAVMAAFGGVSPSASLSGLVSTVATRNNLEFLGHLVAHFVVNIFTLFLELHDPPEIDPWYVWVFLHLFSKVWVFRYTIDRDMPDTPLDLRHMWSALPAFFSESSESRISLMHKINMAPLNIILPIFPFLRKPTAGPPSCPWGVWLYWCIGCHFLLFVNSCLHEPEPNPVIYNSARYTLGVGLLAVFYHKLRLFNRDQFTWMAIFAALPVSSHIMGRLLEETLPHTSLIMAYRPFWFGYSLATIVLTILVSFVYQAAGLRGWWRGLDMGTESKMSRKHMGGDCGTLSA